MNRLKKIFFITALFTAGSGVSQQPNIVFFFSDDHAYQLIGAYKSILRDFTDTPHLDRLAAEGTLFTKAYVTNSICAPSRAVVQTGKYGHENGVRGNGSTFNGSQDTFQKELQKVGYQTAILGKWHLGSEPQGFDYYEIMQGQGAYFSPRFRQNQDFDNMKTYSQEYNSDVVGDRALDWLQNLRDQDAPFMLMAQFKACHRNWMPPARHAGAHNGDVIPAPASLYDDFTNWDNRGSAANVSSMSLGGRRAVGASDPDWIWSYDDKRDFSSGTFGGMSSADIDLYHDAYDEFNAAFPENGTGQEKRDWYYERYIKDMLGAGRSIDDNVGRILQYLDDNDLTDNTIVIYTSDQGFYLGEHSWFDKRWMYEQSLRTPLIVRWPGEVPAGKVNNTDIVSNLDFAQTFIEVAGAEEYTGMQGASLVPVLKGQTPADWRTSFYYQYSEHMGHGVPRHYGVTTGRYKLIWFPSFGGGEWEFYDLKRDPGEMINQIDIPENADLIDSLKTELDRLRALYDAPGMNTGGQNARNLNLVTEQIPLVGCTDPQYEEYDPDAEEMYPGACITAAVDSKLYVKHGLRFNSTYEKGAVKINFLDGSKNDVQIKIFDIKGNIVTKKHFDRATSVRLPINRGSGIYFIEVNQKGNSRSGKLVI